jgi:hypothetical protein
MIKSRSESPPPLQNTRSRTRTPLSPWRWGRAARLFCFFLSCLRFLLDAGELFFGTGPRPLGRRDRRGPGSLVSRSFRCPVLSFRHERKTPATDDQPVRD